MASPALLGRYLLIGSDQDDGRNRTMIGRTKSRPNRVEMPPAVLRSSAPRPIPSSPTTVRNRAAPITARSTPELLRLVCRCLDVRIDWPIRKAPSTVGTMSTRVTAANTAALAHRTGRRAGTAAKVARIIPVAYSPVMSSTPRTPIASCARTVSYTHLRAHETVLDLVCRLLLEKKKK